jgi:hypothetical protein
MAEHRSGGRGPVQCEAAEGGGALAPHLTDPWSPDIILARRHGADQAGAAVSALSSAVFVIARLRMDSPRSSIR